MQIEKYNGFFELLFNEKLIKLLSDSFRIGVYLKIFVRCHLPALTLITPLGHHYVVGIICPPLVGIGIRWLPKLRVDQRPHVHRGA